MPAPRSLLLPGLAATCLIGLATMPSAADVLSLEGTFANVGGLPVGVMVGDGFQIEIDYDPSSPPIAQSGIFLNAIRSISLAIPAASISLTGTGVLTNSASVVNDLSNVLDQIDFSIDGVAGTNVLGGEVVDVVSVVIQEFAFLEIPDLLTEPLALPMEPLDFETSGSITLAIGLTSDTAGEVFSGTSVDVTPAPEPDGVLAMLFGVVALAGLGRRRKR